MRDKWNLSAILDKCDLYFEGRLISKEDVIKKYSETFISSFNKGGRSVNLALHTGSVCFDAVSVLFAALSCLASDDYSSSDVLDALTPGDIVLFGEKKQERYEWCGYTGLHLEPLPSDVPSEQKHNISIRQKNKRGEYNTRNIPKDRWHLITPYHGKAKITDGRGLRGQSNNHIDFISYFTGSNGFNVSKVTKTSVVIVSKRNIFDRITNGLEIKYSGKSIGLLDFITASYYSESGNEAPYRGNPGKNEPILKVTEKISAARNIILDKSGNETVGLFILNFDDIPDKDTELQDLLERKKPEFILMSTILSSDKGSMFPDEFEELFIFATTKNFFLKNSTTVVGKSSLANELNVQIKNIINNNVSTDLREGGLTWEDHKKFKNALRTLRESEWDEQNKDEFIKQAYSVFNLLTTAAFPICILEDLIEKQSIQIVSPIQKIEALKRLRMGAGDAEGHCGTVIELLGTMYDTIFNSSPKHDALRQEIQKTHGKIAIVVPKKYYIDILTNNNAPYGKNVTFITVNRFDPYENYEKIISLGDYRGKRFNPFRCYASANVKVILYGYEKPLFEFRRTKNHNIAQKIDIIAGNIENVDADYRDLAIEFSKNEDLEEFIRQSDDLERLSEEMNNTLFRKFVNYSGHSGTFNVSEVPVIGRFADGRFAMFSNHYRALTFNATEGKISEINAKDLCIGDTVIFTKRSGQMRNVVDQISDIFIESGKLDERIIRASERSHHWKKVLKGYMEKNSLNYREVTNRLCAFGNTRQEATIRQWLCSDSDIIGPREKESLVHIAKLTGDTEFSNDIDQIYLAFSVTRRQRKKVFGIIKAEIVDLLNGTGSEKNSAFESVYDSIENLFEALEIEEMTSLDVPLTVPAYMVNKPIEKDLVI